MKANHINRVKELIWLKEQGVTLEEVCKCTTNSEHDADPRVTLA